MQPRCCATCAASNKSTAASSLLAALRACLPIVSPCGSLLDMGGRGVCASACSSNGTLGTCSGPAYAQSCLASCRACTDNIARGHEMLLPIHSPSASSPSGPEEQTRRRITTFLHARLDIHRQRLRALRQQQLSGTRRTCVPGEEGGDLQAQTPSLYTATEHTAAAAEVSLTPESLL
jgi:hypothetical protein